MLAPTPSPRMITHSQSRPLRESLLIALVMIGHGLCSGFMVAAMSGVGLMRAQVNLQSASRQSLCLQGAGS